MSVIERDPDENEGWQTVGSRDLQGRAAKWEQTANEERERADTAERQLRGAVDTLEKIAREAEARVGNEPGRNVIAASWLVEVTRNALGGQST